MLSIHSKCGPTVFVLMFEALLSIELEHCVLSEVELLLLEDRMLLLVHGREMVIREMSRLGFDAIWGI